LPIIRRGALTNCFRGTGNRSAPLALPLELAPSPSAYIWSSWPWRDTEYWRAYAGFALKSEPKRNS
jgi:hypothetical protein